MPTLTQAVCQPAQKAKIYPKDFAKVFRIAGFLPKNPRKWLILTKVLKKWENPAGKMISTCWQNIYLIKGKEKLSS
ncbi:MAG TPA: hypothetical protein VK815_06000 [Candidatus Acidoferrales bacterium]|jgi:hypothetical protein|nr:hypothetical protein [Candidatus Acidoferrales bacterium]